MKLANSSLLLNITISSSVMVDHNDLDITGGQL